MSADLPDTPAPFSHKVENDTNKNCTDKYIPSVHLVRIFGECGGLTCNGIRSPKGSQAARTAEAFFRYLAESGFTENTVELIPRSEADSVKALTLYWAVEWYYDIQDYDRCIEYSSKALSLSRKVSAKEIECDCDNILSIAYFRKSDFHKSLEYAKATLALGRELQDEERITYSLNTLAGICLASKQPAEGVKYVLEAIHFRRSALCLL